MTHLTLADLPRFYQRYDRRNRFVLGGALVASLTLSSLNLIHGVSSGPGGRGAALGWMMGVLFAPLVILGWWAATEYIARWREKRPAMSADDLPNGLRVANAGFLYSLALMGVVLGTQILVTLGSYGYGAPGWVSPVTMCVFGLALVCLGNVWPRLPTPRPFEPKAAKEMRINRAWGWIMVIMGLGLILPTALLLLRAITHG